MLNTLYFAASQLSDQALPAAPLNASPTPSSPGRTRLGDPVRLGSPQQLLPKPPTPPSQTIKSLGRYAVETLTHEPSDNEREASDGGGKSERERSPSLLAHRPGNSEKRVREQKGSGDEGSSSPTGRQSGAKVRKSIQTPRIGASASSQNTWSSVANDEDESEAPREDSKSVTLVPQRRVLPVCPSRKAITPELFNAVIDIVVSSEPGDADYTNVLSAMRRRDRLNLTSASRRVIASVIQASDRLGTPEALLKFFVFLEHANGTHETVAQMSRGSRNARARFSINGAQDGLSQALIARTMAVAARESTTADDLSRIGASLGLLFSRDKRAPLGADLFAHALRGQPGLQGDKLNALATGFANGLDRGKQLWASHPDLSGRESDRGSAAAAARMHGRQVFIDGLREVFCDDSRAEGISALLSQGPQRSQKRRAQRTVVAASSSSTSSSSTSTPVTRQIPGQSLEVASELTLRARTTRAVELARTGGCSFAEARQLGKALGMRLTSEVMAREVEASISHAVPSDDPLDMPTLMVEACRDASDDEESSELLAALLEGLFSAWPLTDDRASGLESATGADLSVFREE